MDDEGANLFYFLFFLFFIFYELLKGSNTVA